VHRACPAAAADYFFVSVPRVALAAIVVNALPFSRRLQIQHSLQLCQHLLANPGNVLILFPEGTRSTTGQIGEFKPGVGLLVAGTDLPVVPCRLDGAFEAWPKGALCPRPRQMRLTIGAPRYFAGLPPTKESARGIARMLQEAVEALAV
jgi:1-acyl-sn-glycerol-3-phosphate acyltransferase